MMTLRKLAAGLDYIPATTSCYLADLGEAKGKQMLFTWQSPRRLKMLREHALIESAVSSNRIEGVEIDKSRIRTVIFGKPLLRDRNEEEVWGYREALRLVHEQGNKLPVSEKTVLELHRLTRGEIWDAGKYKEQDGDIIERFQNGSSRVRFKTIPATETPTFMKELLQLWHTCLNEGRTHPLIVMAALNLDFLCIHPFRDGNGRVSRLLLLLQCYHFGYEVGRYISLERLIEENKERYYETLNISSNRWHVSENNPWPYINYLLFILKTAYKEFENRIGQIKAPRGEKTELIVQAIEKTMGPFRVADVQKACPGVGLDLIRRIMKRLRSEGRIECLGRGQNAEWQKTERK